MTERRRSEVPYTSLGFKPAPESTPRTGRGQLVARINADLKALSATYPTFTEEADAFDRVYDAWLDYREQRRRTT